jgi:glutamate/tyrosine decarboxylase-like PLP-dependent enzyme
MVALGQEGYEQKLLEIYESAQMILKGIQKQIPELVIHGNPITSVVAFRFTKSNYLINTVLFSLYI